jgi:hypothetical protein
LLSDAEAQLAYERDVPIADVCAELFESTYDSLHPAKQTNFAAFTEEERTALIAFESLLIVAADKVEKTRVTSVRGLQLLPEWRKVMTRAKELHDLMSKKA